MSLTLPPPATSPPCGPAVPAGFCIPTMGGGQVCLPQLPHFQDPLIPSLELMRSLGVFMIPLIPVIKILAALVAIKDFIVGLPENIVQLVALNPQPLADSISNVVEKMAAVAQLALPQVAFAAMLRGVVQALLAYLVALRARVSRIISAYERINAAIQQATNIGNASMRANAICARENVDTRLAALIASMSPIATVLAIFNVILCLVLGHGVASLALPDLSGDINQALAPIDAAIAAVTLVLNLIPNIGATSFEC